MTRITAPGKKTNGMQQLELNKDDVAQVAYALFEQRGCMHGHDEEDWLRAEQIVRQRLSRRTAR